MENGIKDEILNLIKTDTVLLGKVAEVTKRELSTVLRKLSPYDNKLLSYSTLKVISEHTGRPIEDLIDSGDGQSIEEISEQKVAFAS